MEMIQDIREFEKVVRKGDLDGIDFWIDKLFDKWKLEVKFRNDEIHFEAFAKDLKSGA